MIGFIARDFRYPTPPEAVLASKGLWIYFAIHMAVHGLYQLLCPVKMWKKYEGALCDQGITHVRRTPEWDLENRASGWRSLKLAVFFAVIAAWLCLAY